MPETIGGGASGLGIFLSKGELALGSVEGKKLGEVGGYEEYDLGAVVPAR